MSLHTPKILLEHVAITFGKRLVVQDISLALQEHDLLCIVGPSGCGKTTLLRAVAGLMPLSRGRILLDGAAITRPTSRIAMIFQHFGLFPWKTVRANIEYGLSVQGRRDENGIAMRLLEVMGLAEFAQCYPYELSGGMQQRVGIARALAVQPEVLLLDEPFSAVDAITREMLQGELIRLWEDPQRRQTTAILVTHDLDEAILLGDRIVVLGSTGQLCLDLNVPIPRPRTPQNLRFHAAYPQLRNQIWEALHGSGNVPYQIKNYPTIS
ncbi:MAG: ABC transporter ATP-binding protein [Pelatocladus maniniholoensis HA4357-MV3]|jgi:NitT/TauT family transport system ATP-binding protein|uniref:ABC transporter ATP-binding protein n=1 Tax=Pelatocladus maniniholoensis HA4357-MV3 TaxID=1117104 RepID=A0A9E3H534_9NOST|nr:ABC transporter ATP-binding protein [Pelatocladus maniniholoensis HA4357-MV3]